jgi:hypothetical protein
MTQIYFILEPGGICDMTLLYYFANNGGSKFVGLRLPEYPYLNQDLHLGTYGNHTIGINI